MLREDKGRLPTHQRRVLQVGRGGAGDLCQILVAQLRLTGGQVPRQTRQPAVAVQRVLCGRDGKHGQMR